MSWIVTESGREPANARQVQEYDRFADALRQYTHAPIEVIESGLEMAPADGFVLFNRAEELQESLAGCPPELRQSLPARLILLNVDRSDVFQLLNDYKLCAAIEQLSYFTWLHDEQSSEGAYGLHGLCSIATKIGAYTTLNIGDYCVLGSDKAKGLPALLVAYLEAYSTEVKDNIHA